jgi:hypothetical protein
MKMGKTGVSPFVDVAHAGMAAAQWRDATMNGVQLVMAYWWARCWPYPGKLTQ